MDFDPLDCADPEDQFGVYSISPESWDLYRRLSERDDLPEEPPVLFFESKEISEDS